MNIREYALESLIQAKQMEIYNNLIELINKDIERNTKYLSQSIYDNDDTILNSKKAISEIERYTEMANRVKKSMNDNEDISDILQLYKWQLSKTKKQFY